MALPEYDPACGLSRFDWILDVSKTIRSERIAAASNRQMFSQLDRLAMAEHDAAMDAAQIWNCDSGICTEESKAYSGFFGSLCHNRLARPGGKVLPGLVKRRVAEKALFLS